MKLQPNQKLIYRVACLFVHDAKVLFHRAEMDSFFTLAGGSVEFGESSIEAIQREMREELRATVKVERLIWVAENFFNYRDKDCHEIGLYYETKFTDDSLKFYNLNTFDGIESEFIVDQQFKLHFEWIPLEQIKNFDIRPAFLKKALLKIPHNTEVRGNRDEEH